LGTVGILMVAEVEGEGALGEVVVMKVTTLGQVMVVVGALAGETVGEVATETGTMTMKDGPSVKVVAGHNLLTGITTKGLMTEIRVSQKANLAGGVTIMIAGERQNHLVEIMGQETTGVRTYHLPLSWVSQVAIRIVSRGVLLATQPLLEARILSGKGMMIAGILQGELEEQRNLHGVRQKLLLRKMVSWSKAKGVGAREEAEAAVPGIDLMIHGTTIRVVPLAMADGKLAPEKLSLVDATMYILLV
jgi:hypothetical protein